MSMFVGTVFLKEKLFILLLGLPHPSLSPPHHNLSHVISCGAQPINVSFGKRYQKFLNQILAEGYIAYKLIWLYDNLEVFREVPS